MKILLTNDDGYDAKGIRILFDVLVSLGHEVTLVGPEFHQSGASSAFSLAKGFHFKKHDENIYSVDGTPVDNVLLALQIFKYEFDIVVSGCNNGLNISYDTLYSGTIGACIEALNHDIPAIAISTDYDNFEIVKENVANLFNFIFDHKLYQKGVILNCNFPFKKFKEIKDIVITKHFFKKDSYYFNEVDGVYYQDRNECFDCDDPETELYNLNQGCITITPLTNSYFNDQLYKHVKKKLHK